MKTNNPVLFAVSICALMIFGCTNEALRDFPRVKTLPATVREMEGAVLTGEILNHTEFSISRCGFFLYKGKPSQSTYIGSLTGTLNKDNGQFTAEFGTGIKKGEEYYYTAFAMAESFITLGNEISYVGIGAETARVLDFFPERGTPKDTILIELSENIGGVSDLAVTFNNRPAYIVDFQDDLLRAIVPESIDLESTISIRTGSTADDSEKKFKLSASQIIDFYPKTGQTLDTISIQIGDFPEKGRNYTVRFNGIQAVITSIQNDILKVIVPTTLSTTESVISIQSGDYFTYYSEQKFQLTPCIINSFSPAEVYPFETVTIYGTNFHKQSYKNIVKFDGLPVSLVSSSTTELKLVVPEAAGGGNRIISVTIDNQTTTFLTPITIFGPRVVWERVADFPGGPGYKLGAFAIGEYGYVGLGKTTNDGYSKKFWQYRTTTNSWVQVANFPGDGRCVPAGFTLNGVGYVGVGYNPDSYLMTVRPDFYKYNIGTDSWTTIGNYPGNYINTFVGTWATADDKAYISFSYDDFYSFQGGTNIWSKLSTPATGMKHAGSSFMIDNTMYCVGGVNSAGIINNEVWAYNTITGTWTRKNDFPGQARRTGIAFSSGNLGFFGLGANSDFSTMYNDIWKYDSLTDTWTRTVDFPGIARTSPFVFVIDNYAYIGTGLSAAGVLTNQVYRLVMENAK